MVGDSVIQGAQPVEYIEETSFASPVADGTYKWFGAVTAWSATQGVESQTISYLPDEGASNKLEKKNNVKVAEMWEGELTYHPQDLNMLQYFTGSDGGTSDTLTSLQIGEIDESNGQYRRMLGAVGEEFTMTFAQDEVAEFEASFVIGDGEDWTSTDYIGSTGSHAPENTAEPMKYGDLSNIQLDGAAIGGAVEEMEIEISNDLATVKDPDSSLGSYITALVPTTREVTVSLTLTYQDFSMAQKVRNYNDHTLTFDVDDASGTTHSFTIDGVNFPEFPYEFGPEDLVTDDLESDPCNSITWSSA